MQSQIIFNFKSQINTQFKFVIQSHFVRSFHTSSALNAKKGGGGGGSTGEKLTKLTRATVRSHFASEDERQWHFARQLFLQREPGYGHEGHVMKFNFYKDPSMAEVKIKPKSEYPEWIFKSETYERISADRIPEWKRRFEAGELTEEEVKRYNRTLRRFKMKLYLQHGKNWKHYWKTLMEGKYDFYE